MRTLQFTNPTQGLHKFCSWKTHMRQKQGWCNENTWIYGRYAFM